MDRQNDPGRRLSPPPIRRRRDTMPFERGWTAHKALKWDYEIPTYAKEGDQNVGARLTGQFEYLTPSIISSTDIDESAWAAADGQALVLAVNLLGAEVWAAREFLRDPAYQSTERSIQEIADQTEPQLLETFWHNQRQEFDERAEIVLETEVKGRDSTDTSKVVTVPPGIYINHTVIDGRILPQQLAPFSIQLSLTNGAHVSVAPDDVAGVDNSHVTEAQNRGTATRLSAETVTARFATTATIIQRYLPTTQWLTDQQLHYPTPREMGAVFVLGRKPKDDSEIEQALEDSPELFEQGLTSPGVRLDDHIYVRDDQLGTGTEYHEAMHMLSHRSMRAVLGWDFNEGTTEYFTRLLLAESVDTAVRNDAQYSSQRAGVEFLIDRELTTPLDLANAYFKGELEPLFTTMREATSGTELVSLQAYAHALGATSYYAQDHLGRVLDQQL
ncbi:hypothetical protein [Micromonospora sp. LOL_024]|uniref:hypothetical protein n=1 Tax=Micromonospora sp. LOL_024 TaxID=3345412 RepID=UPI003A871FBC